MLIKLAMGFDLTFKLPPKLAKSYALPTSEADFFTFWRVIEPSLHVVLNHHPHRAPGEPLALLRAFRIYMTHVSQVKDIRKRWRSTADSAAHRPATNLAPWRQYDPSEQHQLPYCAWFLVRFSNFVTKIGFDL